ncbi:hypothetical protein HYALB_00002197 [Hymenoscyphus albidus]|uniref:2EXR domain-containing protein n=1 Tax=Hymenoscyphus albidus TaxID=595503 RepID=A0A9N9LIV0_9HELO|nr:hypothetical protein HYALB_00002197 [Hymenoscyphus albidus]
MASEHTEQVAGIAAMEDRKLQKFACFPELSTELRLDIWELALPRERIIEFPYRIYDGPDSELQTDTYFAVENERAPALFFVSKEANNYRADSREEALSHMHQDAMQLIRKLVITPSRRPTQHRLWKRFFEDLSRNLCLKELMITTNSTGLRPGIISGFNEETPMEIKADLEEISKISQVVEEQSNGTWKAPLLRFGTMIKADPRLKVSTRNSQ